MGMVYWLGMIVATVVLDSLGGQSPEWNLEDKQLLDTMKSLTEHRTCDKVQYNIDFACWDQTEHKSVTDTEKVKQSDVDVKKSKVALKQLDSDDCDDSDDDDLPAYDMSNDTPFDKDKKPIKYIRDVLEHLSDPESLQQEECLERIPEFAVTRLQYEDESVVQDLVNMTVHLQNKFDTEQWVSLRQSALTSVIVCSPITCATNLTKVNNS